LRPTIQSQSIAILTCLCITAMSQWVHAPVCKKRQKLDRVVCSLYPPIKSMLPLRFPPSFLCMCSCACSPCNTCPCIGLRKRMLMCAVIPLTHPLIQRHTGMRTEPVAVLVCALMCAMHAVSQPASTLRLRDAKVRHTCILHACYCYWFRLTCFRDSLC
jgi:hypothetical protein